MTVRKATGLKETAEPPDAMTMFIMQGGFFICCAPKIVTKGVVVMRKQKRNRGRDVNVKSMSWKIF